MKAFRQMRRSADLARQTQNVQGPGLDKILSGLTATNRNFGVVLSIVNGADRRPPAQAYALYQEALRELDRLTAAFNNRN